MIKRYGDDEKVFSMLLKKVFGVILGVDEVGDEKAGLSC